MTIEAFKKAETILKRIEKVEFVLGCLKEADTAPRPQLKGIATEDYSTSLTLWFDDEKHLREDGAAFPSTHLTVSEITVMQHAFEKHKRELEQQLAML